MRIQPTAPAAFPLERPQLERTSAPSEATPRTAGPGWSFDRTELLSIRSDLEGLLSGVYDGTLGDEAFQKGLETLMERHGRAGMSDADKARMAHDLTALAKLENNVHATQQASRDPELIAKSEELFRTPSRQPGMVRNPYADWINPKLIQRYRQAQELINVWGKSFAETLGVAPSAVWVPNLDWGRAVTYQAEPRVEAVQAAPREGFLLDHRQ